MGMVLFARNTLLEQPEFQERLADATVLGRRVTTAREAGDEWGWRFWGQIYWEALAEWARDLDGLYSGAELDALISRQPEPKVIRRATVATMAGRSGRGKTLDTQVIRAAVRSLALRPEARKQLNDERSRSYRYRRGAFRPQVGHEHSPMGHDRGVTRADELVAAEISEHGRTATVSYTHLSVQLQDRAREDLGDRAAIRPRREGIRELNEALHVDHASGELREPRKEGEVEGVAFEADRGVAGELVEHAHLLLRGPVQRIGASVEEEVTLVLALLVRKVADVARVEAARGRREYRFAVRAEGAVHRGRDDGIGAHTSRLLPHPPTLVPEDSQTITSRSARFNELEHARLQVRASVSSSGHPLLGQRSSHVLLEQ